MSNQIIELKYEGRTVEVPLTEELKVILKDLVKKGKYGFEENQEVFALESSGVIISCNYEAKERLSKAYIARNKYFHTWDEAYIADEKQLLTAEIDHFIEANGGEFTEEEWKNASLRKWGIEVEYESDQISLGWDVNYKFRQPFNPYFRSEEIAEKAIVLFGDRMKKYLL